MRWFSNLIARTSNRCLHRSVRPAPRLPPLVSAVHEPPAQRYEETSAGIAERARPAPISGSCGGLRSEHVLANLKKNARSRLSNILHMPKYIYIHIYMSSNPATKQLTPPLLFRRVEDNITVQYNRRHWPDVFLVCTACAGTVVTLVR